MPQNRNSKIGQGPAMPVAERGFVPAAEQPHVTAEDLGSVLGLSVPRGANYIMMQAHTQNVRYTLDGSDPSTTHGFVLVAGESPTILPVVGGRTTLKFIENTADAVLEYQYGE